MKKAKKQIIILSLITLFFAANFTIALAATPIGDAITGGVGPTVKEAYGTVTPDLKLDQALIKIINDLLTFLAILFFLGLIYAGYLWMMARGNEEEITKAKKITREIVIGLLIILLSRLITEFIIFQLGNVTK